MLSPIFGVLYRFREQKRLDYQVRVRTQTAADVWFQHRLMPGVEYYVSSQKMSNSYAGSYAWRYLGVTFPLPVVFPFMNHPPRPLRYIAYTYY